MQSDKNGRCEVLASIMRRERAVVKKVKPQARRRCVARAVCAQLMRRGRCVSAPGGGGAQCPVTSANPEPQCVCACAGAGVQAPSKRSVSSTVRNQNQKPAAATNAPAAGANQWNEKCTRTKWCCQQSVVRVRLGTWEGGKALGAEPSASKYASAMALGAGCWRGMAGSAVRRPCKRNPLHARRKPLRSKGDDGRRLGYACVGRGECCRARYANALGRTRGMKTRRLWATYGRRTRTQETMGKSGVRRQTG